jgi:hypothetical protein
MIKILFLLSVCHIVHISGAAIWTDTFTGVCGWRSQEQVLDAPPDYWVALTNEDTGISDTLFNAGSNTVGCFTSDYYPG